MWISIKNRDQVIWLAGNYKWVWYLNLFSVRRVNIKLGQGICCRSSLCICGFKCGICFVINCSSSITKTCLYSFDPVKPHFYIVKLGFTGVYIIFLFLLRNIYCGYSLELPGGSSNEYPQSVFWAEIWKISEIFIWKFSFFWWENFQFIWKGMFS